MARVVQAQGAEFPRAEALRAEIDRLLEFVADDARSLGGAVRLSLQPSVSWPLVGDLVAAVRQRHRNLHLQIAQGPTRQIEESLADGRVDLGVVSLRPAPEVGECVSPEIRQTFYLVVGARRHASAAVQAVADLVRDLAGRLGKRPRAQIGIRRCLTSRPSPIRCPAIRSRSHGASLCRKAGQATS